MGPATLTADLLSSSDKYLIPAPREDQAGGISHVEASGRAATDSISLGNVPHHHAAKTRWGQIMENHAVKMRNTSAGGSRKKIKLVINKEQRPKHSNDPHVSSVSQGDRRRDTVSQLWRQIITRRKLVSPSVKSDAKIDIFRHAKLTSLPSIRFMERSSVRKHYSKDIRLEHAS